MTRNKLDRLPSSKACTIRRLRMSLGKSLQSCNKETMLIIDIACPTGHPQEIRWCSHLRTDTAPLLYVFVSRAKCCFRLTIGLSSGIRCCGTGHASSHSTAPSSTTGHRSITLVGPHIHFAFPSPISRSRSYDTRFHSYFFKDGQGRLDILHRQCHAHTSRKLPPSRSYNTYH